MAPTLRALAPAELLAVEYAAKLPAECMTGLAAISWPAAASGEAGQNGAARESEGAEPPMDTEQIPDVLTPSPADSTDANGIAIPSAAAPQTPLRTRSRRVARVLGRTIPGIQRLRADYADA